MDPIFKVYFDALSKELRNLVLSYLGNCIDRNKHSLADLVNLVSSNPQEKEEIMTSIMAGLAQDIKQEARQQGVQQGVQQEKLHIAKNMLSKLHLDIKAVKEATGLSEEELMKLQEEAKR
jgi:predicted transposase/invertase (TIGR01784 family)